MAINLLRIFIFVPFHIKTVNIFQNKEECQMDKNEAIIRYAMQHGKLDDLKVWLLNGGSVNEYFTSHKQNIKLVIKEKSFSVTAKEAADIVEGMMPIEFSRQDFVNLYFKLSEEKQEELYDEVFSYYPQVIRTKKNPSSKEILDAVKRAHYIYFPDNFYDILSDDDLAECLLYDESMMHNVPENRWNSELAILFSKKLADKGAYYDRIYKLLNLRPCGDTVLCKSEGDPIDAGLIIVDEVSMLDLEIASYLFPAVRNGAIIILCGDDNQLESVGYGKVLADLIDCGKVEVYRLYQIMRQSGTICENASIILSGSAEIKLDESFSLHRYTSDNEAVKAMMSNLKYECSFVLSPVKKKGEAGVYALNKIIQESIPNLTYCFSYNNENFHIGDRIIMTQTNYDQGYFNGDIGTISSFCEGILSVTFFDKVLSLSRDDFANMQLAYSITVHKSQGSEIDDVHIILPDSCKNMLTRRIVYTAITRAKSHVYIYSVGDAFEYAVKNKAEHQRRSNLVYRIQNG